MKKKQLNLDMTLGSSYVNKAGTVINSNYSNKDLLTLSGWSKDKIKHRFVSSIAFTKHRDARTYAQVVADKSDSGHKVVHNNAGVQYRKPVVGFCALTHKVVHTNLSTSKAKENTVGKQKVFEFQIGLVKTQKAEVSDSKDLHSDPIDRYPDGL